jgi:hypothetical protein
MLKARLTGDGSPYRGRECALWVGRIVPMSRSCNESQMHPLTGRLSGRLSQNHLPPRDGFATVDQQRRVHR